MKFWSLVIVTTILVYTNEVLAQEARYKVIVKIYNPESKASSNKKGYLTELTDFTVSIASYQKSRNRFSKPDIIHVRSIKRIVVKDNRNFLRGFLTAKEKDQEQTKIVE